MSVPISIRLPEETAKALDAVASATDRPKTYVVLRALEAYLADYADYQIALDRLRDKDDPVVSASALRARLTRKR
ncbi:MAG TPA: ribbon-helix-helix protein, CopG family [bacterium]|jgi:RHH-type transcriptional regulator, rel operon repressor / antitoxin RelB|nr:ribbon-helix-helix protein, CopG family [bacterium]